MKRSMQLFALLVGMLLTSSAVPVAFASAPTQAAHLSKASKPVSTIFIAWAPSHSALRKYVKTEERALLPSGGVPKPISTDPKLARQAQQVQDASPNGKLLLRSYENAENAEIFTPDGHRVAIIPNLNSPSFGPANILVGYGPSGIETVHADGSNRHLVYPGNFGGKLDMSPDGQHIVFEAVLPGSGIPGTEVGLYEMNGDGSGLRQLTDGSVDVVYDHVSYQERYGNPIFSPDNHIGYAHAALESNVYAEDLWIMDGNGGSRRNMTNLPTTQDYGPLFSPDGSQIAFVQAGYGSPVINQYGVQETSISIVNVDGSGFHTVSCHGYCFPGPWINVPRSLAKAWVGQPNKHHPHHQ